MWFLAVPGHATLQQTPEAKSQTYPAFCLCLGLLLASGIINPLFVDTRCMGARLLAQRTRQIFENEAIKGHKTVCN